MSKRVQRRRGTAAEHTSGTGFTGEIGEITVDTTANTIRIHDGITKGGHPLSRADASNLDLTNKINVNELNLAEGTDGQVLQTDGAGTLSFTDPTVGGDISGTIKNAQIVADSVGVTELNVSPGTAGQALTITGAGTLLFADVVTDPTVGGDLSGTTSNAQIVANAVGAAEIATNAVSVNELNVAEGQPNTYLKTDGAGNLSFAAVSGGGLNSSSWEEDTFTGDGSTTTFTLTQPANVNGKSILVYVDGVNQPIAAYTQSGLLSSSTSMTISPAPHAGAAIRVLHLGIYSEGLASGSSNFVEDLFTGDGSTTVFNYVTSTPTKESILVFIDGVAQPIGTYTLPSLTSISIVPAPYVNASIRVLHLGISQGLASGSSNFVEDIMTGDGLATTFTFTTGTVAPTKESILVYIDGVNQPISAYTLPTTTSISFSPEVPIAGAVIRVLHLGIAGAINNSNTGSGGSTTFVANGTLPNGCPVILNTDGTVSAVSSTTTGQAATPHFVVPGLSRPNQQRCKFALDPNNDTKFVCSYYTAADAAYTNVNICVGTIDKVNKTISFGTPFVPHTGAMEQADGLTYIKSSLAGYHGRFVFCAELSPGNFQGNCWSMLVAGAGTGTTITLESGPVQYNGGNRTTYNFVDSDPHHPGYFMVTHGTVGSTRLCQFFMTPGTGALAFQSSHTIGWSRYAM